MYIRIAEGAGRGENGLCQSWSGQGGPPAHTGLHPPPQQSKELRRLREVRDPAQGHGPSLREKEQDLWVQARRGPGSHAHPRSLPFHSCRAALTDSLGPHRNPGRWLSLPPKTELSIAQRAGLKARHLISSEEMIMTMRMTMVTGVMTGVVTNTRLSLCAWVPSAPQRAAHLVPTAALGVGTIMTPFLRQGGAEAGKPVAQARVGQSGG